MTEYDCRTRWSVCWEASNAMRRHAKAMHGALALVRAGITEEGIDQRKIELIATFNDVQAAWDGYCAHLKEPGVFPVIAASTQL